MNLYQKIQDIYFSSPLPVVIVGLELQMPLAQLKELIADLEKEGYSNNAIFWDNLDMNESIDFLLPNGKKLTIKIT